MWLMAWFIGMFIMWGVGESMDDPTMSVRAQVAIGVGSGVYYVVLLPLALMATL